MVILNSQKVSLTKATIQSKIFGNLFNKLPKSITCDMMIAYAFIYVAIILTKLSIGIR